MFLEGNIWVPSHDKQSQLLRWQFVGLLRFGLVDSAFSCEDAEASWPRRTGAQQGTAAGEQGLKILS